MKRLVLILLLAACGDDPSLGRVEAEVRVDPRLMLSDVKSVDVYLFAGHTASGGRLDCATLGGGSPATRIDVVHRAHLLGPPTDMHLPGLTPESQLVLAVDGYPTGDGTGMRNAYGCTDGIAIMAGKTTPVTVVLAAVP